MRRSTVSMRAVFLRKTTCWCNIMLWQGLKMTAEQKTKSFMTGKYYIVLYLCSINIRLSRQISVWVGFCLPPQTYKARYWWSKADIWRAAGGAAEAGGAEAKVCPATTGQKMCHECWKVSIMNHSFEFCILQVTTWYRNVMSAQMEPVCILQ